MEFTQSLQHLPEIHLDDVHRLADKFSLTTRSKLDKGYKFFIEQYLFAYEGKHFVLSRPTYVSGGVRIMVAASC